MITTQHKKHLIQETIAYLEQELEQASNALASTKSYSQSSDLKQEGKYDTRAIEAGYLAGAQKKRVEELRRDLAIMSNLDEKVLVKNDSISVFSVVELKDETDNISYYFLCSTPAPSSFQINGLKICSVTLESPFGQALINLKTDDDFSLEIGPEEREYLVKSIF
ncbi:hypothetical protein N9N67_06585 [Bacteriovoracaceae bacterium]|nr:hypothetical protein [Bacteriovoracaceae bacterium]